MEVFHFSGSYGVFDPPSLDLSILGGLILCPRETWKYIDFIFNRKLLFHQHVNFYANKAILTVKYMKILGNSSCSLVLYQKRLLYRSCILLIALYSFHLWFYNKMLLSYPLDKLRKMQRRVAIWITYAFQILPSWGIKAIASLIPIYLYLWKLSGRAQLRVHALPHNHILWSLLESRPNLYINQYHLSLDLLTPQQWERIKSSIIDIDNRFNKVFPFFDLYNLKFSPSSRIIDNFHSHFSFHFFSKHSND